MSRTDSRERIMSVTETSSKIHEPKTYKGTISGPIYFRQWKEVMEEEIQNFEDSQKGEFDHLPPEGKAIGLK